MKAISLLLLNVLLLINNGFAQTAELCQGAYFTEPEGKTFLEKHKVSSKLEWEARAEKIRKQIREGMGLTNVFLPNRLLNPLFIAREKWTAIPLKMWLLKVCQAFM
jgi:hypothetical protein